MALSFEQYLYVYPSRVDDALLIIDPRDQDHPIDESAQFEALKYLGLVKSIGANSTIGSEVVVEDDVCIESQVQVGDRTVLMQGVTLTEDLVVGRNVTFFEHAEVQSWSRKRTHQYARFIHDFSIVGPGVILPSEVQIGPYAVVPTTDSIAQIGPFGDLRRMVTVHGSDKGPTFNVACQQEIDEVTFRQRIANATDAVSTESAASYGKNFDQILRLAEKAQSVYENEAELVSELKELAAFEI